MDSFSLEFENPTPFMGMNFDELMRRAHKGDRVAYAEFLERAARSLRAFFIEHYSNFTPTPEDPGEESVQQTLLAIHIKRHTHNVNLPVLPWLYSLAAYYLQKGYEDHGWAEAQLPVEPTLNPQPEHTMIGKPEFDLAADVKRLPALEQKIVDLTLAENLSSYDVAVRTGKPVSFIRRLRHRALRQLFRTAATHNYTRAANE